MSRETKTDFQEAFRLVVTAPWGTSYMGPYQTRGAAKGQKTELDNYQERHPDTPRRTAKVQRLTGTWEDLPE